MSELSPDEPSIATAGAARTAELARGGTDPVAERRRASKRRGGRRSRERQRRGAASPVRKNGKGLGWTGPQPISVRERLPSRRACETFNFELDGLRYSATIARFEDGRIGEIFLGSHKAGSQADTAARDSAIVASIAVQHGADLETIRRGICRDGRGRASGPLGRALDLIAGEHESAEANPGVSP